MRVFGAILLGGVVAATLLVVACGDEGAAPGDVEGGEAGVPSPEEPSARGETPRGTSSDGGSLGDGDGEAGPADGAVTPKPACGSPVSQTGFLGSQTLVVNGVTRSYALYLPPGYDEHQTYPVLLLFHGDGGNGAGMRGSFGIEAASGESAIVAYPDGQGGTWQIDSPAPVAKDVAFVDALLAHLSSTYCTDGRNFLVGMSKGAYFVNQAACRTKATLRGIVSHSGGGPYAVASGESNANGQLVCPAPAVAAMQIHGSSDGTVSLSEGVSTRTYWRAANGCGNTTNGFNPSPCVAYAGCAREEVWCQVGGLGHAVWSLAPSAVWSFVSGL